jgi:hypothetical protein
MTAIYRGFEWRYLPSGRVKHALFSSSDTGAVCGIYTIPASNWLGTGTQHEYERLETLEPCKRCISYARGRTK